MNMEEKNGLVQMTKWLLDVMFFGGMVVTVAVPFLFRWYGAYNYRFRDFYIPLCVIFCLSGILAILILGELRAVFATVLQNDCFRRENVLHLKRMGTYSFCIAVITAFRFFLYFTPSVAILILVFIVAGLFSKVLSQVFDTAVTYKQENDLTI